MITTPGFSHDESLPIGIFSMEILCCTFLLVGEVEFSPCNIMLVIAAIRSHIGVDHFARAFHCTRKLLRVRS